MLGAVQDRDGVAFSYERHPPVSLRFYGGKEFRNSFLSWGES